MSRAAGPAWTMGVRRHLYLAWKWASAGPGLVVRNLWHSLSRAPVAPACAPDLGPCPEAALRVTWLGHATVLVDVFGRRVLTDPHLRGRVLFARRLVAAPVAPESLPALDLVAISHAHLDHLDRGTLRRLGTRSPVVVPGGCKDLVEDLGFESVRELSPGESAHINGIEVAAIEVPHTPYRHPLSKPRGVVGYLLSRRGHSVLFVGDASRMDGRAIARMGRRIDLAVLPVSSYEPSWYRRAHMTPEEAMELFVTSGAARLLPIHRETFILSVEPVKEPLERLCAAAEEIGAASRLILPRIGETVTIPQGDPERTAQAPGGHDDGRRSG